jgi:pimeloyl-ACP methyl ester carboxylesterase
MLDVAISFDGVPIHYEVQGSGTPGLVFVHGWSCDRTYWEGQFGGFASQYQVVAIDLAGHGESGLQRDDWNITAFGQDVAAVAEKLGLKQVVLIGHSMGGPVIVEAARLMADRLAGLVGVDTYRNLSEVRQAAEIEGYLAPLRANFREATGKVVRKMFISRSDPHLVERIVADMSAAPPEVAIAASKALRDNDLNLQAGLQELRDSGIPVVAINSDYRANDFEAARRFGVTIQTMSGVGHFVMMEDPVTFNRLLEETINGLAGKVSGAARARQVL